MGAGAVHRGGAAAALWLMMMGRTSKEQRGGRVVPAWPSQELRGWSSTAIAQAAQDLVDAGLWDVADERGQALAAGTKGQRGGRRCQRRRNVDKLARKVFVNKQVFLGHALVLRMHSVGRIVCAAPSLTS